ncbi:MAG: hypothetical protein DMD47_01195 [Gemmatimonadetes bacterium]|nr:MAG: hypothetical protein DMD47_01195 [Gemmatimonadota bacterium]
MAPYGPAATTPPRGWPPSRPPTGAWPRAAPPPSPPRAPAAPRPAPARPRWSPGASAQALRRSFSPASFSALMSSSSLPSSTASRS